MPTRRDETTNKTYKIGREGGMLACPSREWREGGGRSLAGLSCPSPSRRSRCRTQRERAARAAGAHARRQRRRSEPLSSRRPLPSQRAAGIGPYWNNFPELYGNFYGFPVGGRPPPVGGMPPPVGGMPPPVGGMPPPIGGMPPPIGGMPPPLGK